MSDLNDARLALWALVQKAAKSKTIPVVDFHVEFNSIWKDMTDTISSIKPDTRARLDRLAVDLQNARAEAADVATRAHRMTIVEGEIEVCDTCVNSLGEQIAWEQTWHQAKVEQIKDRAREARLDGTGRQDETWNNALDYLVAPLKTTASA